MDMPKTGEFAHIGKSVVIKGELSGSEDLYVDGTVEGTIQLHGNNLVIGPNGHVHADVNAKGVVVQGKLEGNIRATDRVELRKSAVIVGDIVTQRIAIEDGAYFKGKVEIQKEAKPNRTEQQSDAKSGSAPVASGAAAATSSTLSSGTGSLGAAAPGTTVTKQ
ncbi:MAG TPA: polymer-forming cytoskeletal protein [Terriglobales bacterium]|nr:polymer-forming cytoskeletal protein [Terriglobales bacterium]